MIEPEDAKLSALRLLIAASLDGTATPDQMKQLSDMLVEDTVLRRYYLEYIQIHIGLRRLHQEDIAVMKIDADENFDPQLWEELARNENTAETIEIESPKEDTRIEAVLCGEHKPSVRINKFLIYTILTTAAALILMITYIYFNPAMQPTVAIVSDSINGQWDTQAVVQIGDDIRTELKKLDNGIIKLTFDSGVKVIIESPAEFIPVSANKLILQKGKAFAHVPTNAIGFIIDTPGSSVVDLGTEFGLYVDNQKDSEVHVIQGKVNLVSGLSGWTQQSEIVTQAQARQVDFLNKAIKKVEFCNNFFVRDISSRNKKVWYGEPLNLAWTLNGGNGFKPVADTGGIDPATGQYHPVIVQKMDRIGDNSYHTLSATGFIDGIFVPNGPGVISSTGLRFEGFPYTSKSYWSDITSSPVITQHNENESNQTAVLKTMTASLAYDKQENTVAPLIFMHSNQGITFDLDRIRQAQRGAEIARFRARCGIADNVSLFIKLQSEFWVLIDGRCVFHHATKAVESTQMASITKEKLSDVQAIDIPIMPGHRFLTLATTDGGDGIAYDWCIFENPVLEMIPKVLSN